QPTMARARRNNCPLSRLVSTVHRSPAIGRPDSGLPATWTRTKGRPITSKSRTSPAARPETVRPSRPPPWGCAVCAMLPFLVRLLTDVRLVTDVRLLTDHQGGGGGCGDGP